MGCKGVESTCRGGGLGEEQIAPVEVGEVTDPVRAEHGIAAREWHGVKDARGLAAVVLEGREEGRFVALAHAPVDGKMKVLYVLAMVEHPTEQGQGAVLELRQGRVRHIIHVQFRAELPDHPAEQRSQHRLGGVLVRAVKQTRQVRADQGGHGSRLVRRRIADHHRLDVAVELQGDEGVLKRALHDHVVREGIGGVANLAQAIAQIGLTGRGQIFDPEDLEVPAPAGVAPLTAHRRRRGRVAVILLVVERGLEIGITHELPRHLGDLVLCCRVFTPLDGLAQPVDAG